MVVESLRYGHGMMREAIVEFVAGHPWVTNKEIAEAIGRGYESTRVTTSTLLKQRRLRRDRHSRYAIPDEASAAAQQPSDRMIKAGIAAAMAELQRTIPDLVGAIYRAMVAAR